VTLYPILSRLAQDVLAIPGTSISVERLFSSLWHMMSEERGSMTAETIRMAVLIKEGIKSGLMDGHCFTDYVKVQSKNNL
jgi:hypothetical protein